MLSSSDVRPFVEIVLNSTDNYITAYQILERLPAEIRDGLITQYGAPGAGGGNQFTAASFVSQVAAAAVAHMDSSCRVYINTVDMRFLVAGTWIAAGDPAAAAYRLPKGS